MKPLLLAVAGIAAGQLPEGAPAFEVATIRPYTGTQPDRTLRLPAGRLSATNMTLKDLLAVAYQVRDIQLLGGPAWIDSAGYDIEAKAAGTPNRDEAMSMLRRLLEDRFQVALHRETREAPIYALTVAKSGFRLRASEAGKCKPPELDARLPGQSQSNFSGWLGTPGAGSSETKVRTVTIARALSLILGRPVADRTGITGELPVHLKYSSEELGAGDSPAPSIFTAVQEQLGLKLESTKGPVEMLVIDRAERPSEN